MSEFHKKNCVSCNKEFFDYKPTEYLGYEPKTLCKDCKQKKMDKSPEEITLNE